MITARLLGCSAIFGGLLLVATSASAEDEMDLRFMEAQQAVESPTADAVAKIAARAAAVPSDLRQRTQRQLTEIDDMERRRDALLAEATDRSQKAMSRLVAGAGAPAAGRTHEAEVERMRRFGELKKQVDAELDAARTLQVEANKLSDEIISAKGMNLRNLESDTRAATYSSENAAKSRAVDARDVQGHLTSDEVLVLIGVPDSAKGADAALPVWFVTKSRMELRATRSTASAISEKVYILRCGLDNTVWYIPKQPAAPDEKVEKEFAAQVERAERCKRVVGSAPVVVDGRVLPPFDFPTAHSLYLDIFGDAEALIANKNILLVAYGHLSQLPLSVLMTSSFDGNGQAPWLIRRHAITVLPAVSSLIGFRSQMATSSASKPYLAFGNPILRGPANDERFVESAALATKINSCSDLAQTVRPEIGRGQRLRAAHPTRGAALSSRQLATLTPLPETADEVCAVGRMLGASPDDILLGRSAGENFIRTMIVRNELRRYKVIHFATHGLVSGQYSGSTAPGLVLSNLWDLNPPIENVEVLKYSINEDGYLSGHEIAGLKLDADLVILSACNTASATAESSEPFSGLARAFILANARGVIASHWEVDSAATVKLIVGALQKIQGERLPASEALRRSMIEVSDNGLPHEAHPTYWAPFVVVGALAPRT